MLGLMLAGTEFALRGIDAAEPLLPKPLAWPRGRDDWAQWQPLASLVLGAVLIAMSSQVKLPSLLALGFVAMVLANRWGGTFKAFALASGSLTAVALAVIGVDRVGQRAGVWLGLHSGHRQCRAQLDVTADAAGARDRTGRHPARAGRSHHGGARADPWNRRVHHRDHCDCSCCSRFCVAGCILSVGWASRSGMTVLLFPVVQPWYLLWAMIPLAAWATRPGFSHPRPSSSPSWSASSARRPTATGSRCSRSCSRRGEHRDRAHSHRPDLLPAAVAQAARRRWHSGGQCLPIGEPAIPAPQPAKPGAYAEFP